MIATPCVKVCIVEGDLCIGCGRTLDEIARWTSMTETDRFAAMAVATQRLATAAEARVATAGVERKS